MKVLVDGRVFSSGAHDRGMGRYVSHIIELLKENGEDVTVLLFRNCYLSREDEVFKSNNIRFANYDPEYCPPTLVERQDLAQKFTGFLSALIRADGFDLYIDATPFICPFRLDLLACPIVSVCYDFIPLKYLSDYIVNDVIVDIYYNGLRRLARADAVICISDTSMNDAQRYLGIEIERLCVIAPRLDPAYERGSKPYMSKGAGKPYVFAIAGAHRSKNPTGAVAIYREIVKAGKVDVRLNAPKEDQLDELRRFGDLSGIATSFSITEDEKLKLQANAAAVAHLSLEEGFGIPLLEALFLNNKVIALDIPMNREITGRAGASDQNAILWLKPDNHSVDPSALDAFLAADAPSSFFRDIQFYYRDHWKRSKAILSAAIVNAVDKNREWFENAEFKIFSSVPGTFCGVADYSVAYARSTRRNVVFFFSHGDEKGLARLSNAKVASHNEFAAAQSSKLGNLPTLYNLAFSEALYPGIKLMSAHATPRDVALIHERAYVPGLLHFKALDGTLDELCINLPRGSESDASEASRRLVLAPFSNSRPSAQPSTVAVSADWLSRLPLRFVAHLPPSVLEKMAKASQAGADLKNDLEAIEDRIEFVPLGIDARHGPTARRSSQSLRRRRGIQGDDIVVGHFGLILDNIKRLWDVAYATAHYIAAAKAQGRGGRRVFFVLVGRVVDGALFERIQKLFSDLDIASRLVHSNPIDELDFDAELVACDAVFCFRTQVRGQLSHVFVRALSLGTPVLVNEESGYAYDERTLIADDNLSRDIKRSIDLLFDKWTLNDLRRSARAFYESTHRGDQSLAKLLD